MSKTDYLRGKELKNDVMESVYHGDGRVIKSGSIWNIITVLREKSCNYQGGHTNENKEVIRVDHRT